MTPKSLLRLPAAVSPLDELATGTFQPRARTTPTADPAKVTRVLLCSGKIYYELAEERDAARATTTSRSCGSSSSIRWPHLIAARLARYPRRKDAVWVQDEPCNMGAWPFMRASSLPRVGGADVATTASAARERQPGDRLAQDAPRHRAAGDPRGGVQRAEARTPDRCRECRGKMRAWLIWSFHSSANRSPRGSSRVAQAGRRHRRRRRAVARARDRQGRPCELPATASARARDRQGGGRDGRGGAVVARIDEGAAKATGGAAEPAKSAPPPAAAPPQRRQRSGGRPEALDDAAAAQPRGAQARRGVRSRSRGDAKAAAKADG